MKPWHKEERVYGTCPVCKLQFELRADGRTFYHSTLTGEFRAPCDGSGMTALDPQTIPEKVTTKESK